MSLTRSTWGLVAGVCGTVFVGYCIYFDRKRRSDPNFKRKLHEKRRARQNTSGGSSQVPDLKDQQAVQQFFLREVQLGEELLSQGEIEAGVEHMCNAVAVCGQPQQLLQVLQQTMPPQVFQLVLQRLPAAGQRLMASAGGQSGFVLSEEDVE